MARPARTRADLSAAEARRVALNAQGLSKPWSNGRVTAPAPIQPAKVRRLVARLGALQLDSVNVLVRAHYMPLFSRLGPYPTTLLDRLAVQRRALFEYWGHAASLLPIELHPLFRWRMARLEAKRWDGVRTRIERERPGYVDTILREVAERGPLTLADLADQGRRERVQSRYAESTTAWWQWSDGKETLEGLFEIGRLAVAGRRGFERVYDLPERVIPEQVRLAPTPSEVDAKRSLVRIAAAALGVATANDIADYFRLPVAETKARARELVEDGVLRPVRVEGWRDPAFLDSDAKESRAEARTLLSPFDPMVWDRDRTERLFGFRYRIEIYVPQSKRVHGYYVLPFLLGDAVVARVDLKADRQHRTLVVAAAHLEPGNEPRMVAEELSQHLRYVASWLALERIEIGNQGDLAGHLSNAATRSVL